MQNISSPDSNNEQLNTFLESCRSLVKNVPVILENVVKNLAQEPSVNEGSGSTLHYPFCIFLCSASVHESGRLVLTINNTNRVIDDIEFPGFQPTHIRRKDRDTLHGDDPRLFDTMRQDIRLWFEQTYRELQVKCPVLCSGRIRWCADRGTFIWEQEGREVFVRLLAPSHVVEQHGTLQLQAVHLKDMESAAKKIIKMLEREANGCDTPVATQEKWSEWIGQLRAIEIILYRLRGEFAAH